MLGATEVIHRMRVELVMVKICVKEHLDTILQDFFQFVSKREQVALLGSSSSNKDNFRYEDGYS
jgi:hypothetical protein